MDSATLAPSLSSNLSFDILGHIFVHYAATETVDHPIETLLLVCRWWNEVALGHRALWSRLGVHIDICSLYSSPKVWRVRLPLRLKRCGDTIPLHIDLQHLPSSFARGSGHPHHWQRIHDSKRLLGCPVSASNNAGTRCACITDALLCVDEFLLLLAGRDGSLCRRWKSFHLKVRDPTEYKLEYRQIGPVLRHRMPLLSSLAVQNLGLKNATRSLQHTSLRQNLQRMKSTVSLPSLHSVRSLTVVETRQEMTIGRSTYLFLDEARDVEEIVLEGDFGLPNCMQKLWRLEVAGAIHWPGSQEAQLPSLTHLSLKNHALNHVQKIVEIHNVDLLRLVSLGIHWDPDYNHSTFKGTILDILRVANNLSIIHGNPRGVSMVLKLVWEHEMKCVDLRKRGKDEPRLLGGQRVSITVHQNSAVLQGDESCHQLCSLARSLKVDAPTASWNIILW